MNIKDILILALGCYAVFATYRWSELKLLSVTMMKFLIEKGFDPWTEEFLSDVCDSAIKRYFEKK